MVLQHVVGRRSAPAAQRPHPRRAVPLVQPPPAAQIPRFEALQIASDVQGYARVKITANIYGPQVKRNTEVTGCSVPRRLSQPPSHPLCPCCQRSPYPFGSRREYPKWARRKRMGSKIGTWNEKASRRKSGRVILQVGRGGFEPP